MTAAPSSVLVVATLDTKGREAAFVAERIRRSGCAARLVDVGTGGAPQVAPEVAAPEIAAMLDDPAEALRAPDRGRAIAAMGRALRRWVVDEHAQGRVAGILGLGGSGGTAAITPALQALPVGVPKVMLSTMASGDVSGYVGCSDIALLYSVTDIAGLNHVTRQILSNAAGAVVGMARAGRVPPGEAPLVAMTMFGVTTPCVTAVRERMESAGFDPLVFHATGSGGRAMEKLVASNLLDGVLDITTTEVADEVCGGVLPAGPERFDVILRRGLPYVVSLGALDMVNFGPRESVPPKYRKRNLHVHNPHVTLMRTTPEENRRIAEWIAGKLNAARRAVDLVIPEGGLSALDAPDGPFWDPEADAALVETLAGALQNPLVRLTPAPYHINAPEFAALVAERFLQLHRQQPRARS